MEKRIIINLDKVTCEEQLPSLIYQTLNCNYKSNSVVNNKINWDSLVDNLSGITAETKEITKLVLIFSNTLVFIKNNGLDLYTNLIYTLSVLTDPARRVDGLDFYFQVRESEYDPVKESLHIKLHRGEDGGKDMNN